MSNRSPKLHSEVYSESINYVDSNKRKIFIAGIIVLDIICVSVSDKRLEAVCHVKCKMLLFCLEIAEQRQSK